VLESELKNMKLPLLVYDGDCSFCKLWIERWQSMNFHVVKYAPYQEVYKNYPKIPLTDFQNSIKLILPNGEVYSGAEAIFLSQAYGSKKTKLWLYKNIPGYALISEFIYKIISAHRVLSFHLTRWLWGKTVRPSTYSISRWLFLRLLGLIYLIAFVSLGVQILGLAGSNGILPAAEYFDALRQIGLSVFPQAPAIFWFNSSDTLLQLVPWFGAIFSIALIIGLAQRISLVFLYVLYISLMVAGQRFMTFQWDILLLEVGFLAIFFAPGNILPKLKDKFKPSKIIRWLFYLLLFRLTFASGAVKLLSGGEIWKNLTALNFHYYTQPLPNPLSWLIHQLPEWFDKFSVFSMFGIELIIPFFIFLPRRLRFVGVGLMSWLQILIIISGNYTFFNFLTIGLMILLLDDRLLQKILPKNLVRRFEPKPAITSTNQFKKAVVAVLAIVIVFLGAADIGRLFQRTGLPQSVTKIVNTFRPYRIVNGYGLFAVMTTKRLEIVVQGSNDGENWQDYEFKYKPQDVTELPRQVAPHQPRLDWQMWFAALGPIERSPWFFNFARRLLEGSPEVLALIKTNPFPNSPPKFIRAIIYDYKFTDAKTKKASGRYWNRELLGIYLPASSLK